MAGDPVGRNGAGGPVDGTLGRLLGQLRSELVPLLLTRQNFKIIVNMSAGHKWKIEVVKYLDGE